MATKIPSNLVIPNSTPKVLTPDPANTTGVDGDVGVLDAKYGNPTTITIDLFNTPSAVDISLIGNVGASDFYLIENYSLTSAELVAGTFTVSINKPTLSVKYHINTLSGGSSPYLKFTVL